jgi:chaperonin GroES
MDMKLQPLFNNVLVKPFEQDATTEGGIILPDTAKDKSTKGEVMAVGPGKKSEEGTVIPMSVKEGDKVLLREYGFNEIEISGETFLIGTEESILGVIQ